MGRHKCERSGIKQQQVEKVAIKQEEYSDESSEESEGIHIKAEVEIKEEISDIEEPDVDPLQFDTMEDGIDDDEDAYLLSVKGKIKQQNRKEEKFNKGFEPGERRCQKCAKNFPSDKIKSHIRYCKQDGRHKCDRCAKEFASTDSLNNHVKMSHLKQKERCDICFVRFLNLQAHKDKYHNFKDVDTCNLCGKVVKYLSSHSCPLGPDK